MASNMQEMTDSDSVACADQVSQDTRMRFSQMAPEIIEEYLRGSSWNAALESFYCVNCPRFKDFEPGMEYDLMMTPVHMQFVNSVDVLLEAKFEDLNMHEEELQDLVRKHLADPAAEGLMKVLTDYNDFIEFGLHMRRKYEEMYPKKKVFQHVRVVWDIENIAVPSDLDAFSAAIIFKSFLEVKGYHGFGVDFVMTAFHQGNRGKQFVKDLDRAGVCQMLCTDKREDADRKINESIARDTRLLDPTKSAFVLVSSDTDFKGAMSDLRALGYHVVIVHDYAANHNGSALAALQQHAAEAFRWSDIVHETNMVSDSVTKDDSKNLKKKTQSKGKKSEKDDDASELVLEEKKEPKIANVSHAEASHTRGVGAPAESLPSPLAHTRCSNLEQAQFGAVVAASSIEDIIGPKTDLSVVGAVQPVTALPALIPQVEYNKGDIVEGAELTGKVLWWNSEKGFGNIVVKLQDGAQEKIFCHNTSLPKEVPSRFLSIHEQVRFVVRKAKKGWGASDVNGASGLLECQQQAVGRTVLNGKVVKWNTSHGYGFVKVDEPQKMTLYCNKSDLPSNVRDQNRFLEVGEKVSFNLGHTDKGPCARNVVGTDQPLQCQMVEVVGGPLTQSF